MSSSLLYFFINFFFLSIAATALCNVGSPGVCILYLGVYGHGLDTVVIVLPTPSTHPHGVPDVMGNVDHPTYFSDFHAFLSARGQYHVNDAR
jgi:hypothetical protein